MYFITNLGGCKGVRSGEDTFVLTQLSQLSPKAVSILGHLVRQKTFS